MMLKDFKNYGGRIGAVIGGILGLSLGYALIHSNGDGSPIMTGPLIACMIMGLVGALVVGGLCAFWAGLYHLKASQHRILQSEAALNAGKFGLNAHGSNERPVFARKIINQPSSKVLVEQQPSHEQTNVERWEHSLIP